MQPKDHGRLAMHRGLRSVLIEASDDELREAFAGTGEDLDALAGRGQAAAQRAIAAATGAVGVEDLHRGRTDAMSAAEFNSEILRRIQERAITRLVHFTRVTSLAGIIHDRKIASTESLLDRGVNGVRNDPQRLDSHLDYVCCSIQYPNVYLLDRYRTTTDFTQDWVLLFLTPLLLLLPTTRFSPVNAATAGGTLVQDGIEGFESMFQPRVSAHVKRGPHHLLHCPTDMQAEVLVKHRVPTWAITGIAVESAAVKARVAPLITGWPTDKPIPNWPIERPAVDVEKSLFDQELCKTIRGYKH